MKTIFETINNCKIGQTITDGTRTWTVVSDNLEDDCVIAIPSKDWDKSKSGDPFELWSDAQSKLSYIMNLKVMP